MSVPNFSYSMQFGFKYSWSEHPDLNEALETVWNSLSFEKKPQEKTLVRMKENHKLFLANLHDAMHQNKCIAIHVRSEAFSKGKYSKFHIKRDAFIPLKKALTKAGWIDYYPGFRSMTYENVVDIFRTPQKASMFGLYYYDSDDEAPYEKGALTRIWGTEKLHSLFKELKNMPEKKPSPLILLRDDDGNEMEFEDTVSISQQRQELELINGVYNNNNFTYLPDVFEPLFLNPYCYNYWSVLEVLEKNLDIKKYWTNWEGVQVLKIIREPNFHNISRFHPRLVSIFKNDFYNGGRLYAKPTWGANWQTMSQVQRKYIKINGKRTVELDYRSQHVAIAYSLEKKQLRKKAYEIPRSNIPKDISKVLFLSLFNVDNEVSVSKAMDQKIHNLRKIKKPKGPFITERSLSFLAACNDYNQEWDEDNKVDWIEIINRIKKYHSDIRMYICGNIGRNLQRIDSIIMHKIVLYFAQKGIPCLPVHDSVIIEEQYEDELRKVMEDTFYEVTGSKCKVDKK
jgi:hypothetical protein